MEIGFRKQKSPPPDWRKAWRGTDAAAALAGRASPVRPPPVVTPRRPHGMDYAGSAALCQTGSLTGPVVRPDRLPWIDRPSPQEHHAIHRDSRVRTHPVRPPRRRPVRAGRPELGTIAGRAALERSGVAPQDVGYVVMGEVLQAGVGMIPSRQVSAGMGLPKETGSDTINKVCA